LAALGLDSADRYLGITAGVFRLATPPSSKWCRKLWKAKPEFDSVSGRTINRREPKSIRVVRIFLGWLVLFVVEGMLRIPDGAIFGNFQV
jgi:hypothetical protein